MLAKKMPDPLDGAPFIAGCVTLLRQFHSDNTEHCLTLLGQYVRSMVDNQAQRYNGYIMWLPYRYLVLLFAMHTIIVTEIALSIMRCHLYSTCTLLKTYNYTVIEFKFFFALILVTQS